jgi:hypothetical protein
MKYLIGVLATLALAGLVPSSASAADLYDDEVQGVIIDDRPRVVEHERVIERRYYGTSDDIEDSQPSVEVYARRYRPAYYPERHYWHAYDQW